MLRGFTFGCGQGATKAMITCIENGTLNRDDCCVVNSTTKDIPIEYQRDAIVISDDPDAGCGKERENARGLMADYININPNAIREKIIDYDYVNIIAAAEGASGSGASVVLARWIACTNFADNKDEPPYHIPIIITLITGFESDIRGISNTINYFKDLNGAPITIRTVSNKKFLEKASNTFTAEKLANEDISTAFKIISAHDLDNSEQNIDDTDHFKIITNNGLMFIAEINIDKKIKNPNQFEQLISDAIDYSSSLEFEPSASKIGLYMNVSNDTLANIDTNFPSIKQKLCGSNIIPEFFIHKQYNGKEEYVRIIATGINLPKDEIADLYNKFQNSNITKKEDDFFSAISGMSTSINVEEDNSRPDNTEVDNMLNQFSNGTNSLTRRNRRGSRVTSHTNTTSNINNEIAQISNTAEQTTKSSNRNVFKTSSSKKIYSESSESKGGPLLSNNPFVGK